MKLITFPEKELLLRPITAASAADLLPLMRACYTPVYEHLWEDAGHWYVNKMFSEAAVLQDLQVPDAPYWVVEWQGRPAGILRLNLLKPCPDQREVTGLKLHRIYLHPRTHRQGVGRALIAFIIEYAQKLGRQIVWLEAMDTQTSALRFYETVGFETKGTFRLDYTRMYPAMRGMIRMTVEV